MFLLARFFYMTIANDLTLWLSQHQLIFRMESFPCIYDLIFQCASVNPHLQALLYILFHSATESFLLCSGLQTFL